MSTTLLGCKGVFTQYTWSFWRVFGSYRPEAKDCVIYSLEEGGGEGRWKGAWYFLVPKRPSLLYDGARGVVG